MVSRGRRWWLGAAAAATAAASATATTGAAYVEPDSSASAGETDASFRILC